MILRYLKFDLSQLVSSTYYFPLKIYFSKHCLIYSLILKKPQQQIDLEVLKIWFATAGWKSIYQNIVCFTHLI